MRGRTVARTVGLGFSEVNFDLAEHDDRLMFLAEVRDMTESADLP